MAKDKEKKGGKGKVIAVVVVILLLLGSCSALLEDDGTTETADTATVEELAEMVDEVIELQEYDVAAGTYQPILDAINGAQNVLYHVDDPTDEEITAAYNALVEAKSNAVLIEDAEKNVDNAALLARKYTAGDINYSESMTVSWLVSTEGYDQQTAVDGVAASGVDWDNEAFQYVMGQLTIHSDITVAELISDMAYIGYTDENIAYALVQAGIAS